MAHVSDLILQMPPNIHEGDEVTLRCNTWHSGSAVNTTFYKDDKMIKFLGSGTDLNLGKVYKNTSGKYKCTRVINTDSGSKTFAAEGYILVTELFTSPEIRLNQHPVVEGATMTMTCHTTRGLLSYANLEFDFYKDGKIVQRFGKSNKYKLLPAMLEDSGSYTCEVSSGTMKKISKAIDVNVQGLAVVSFTPNFVKILTTENMTLTCNVDPKLRDKQEYFWYKDGIRMDRTRQSFTIQDAGVSDSGYYQCRSTNTHMSEPLRLDVSNGDLILQSPPYIYFGDNLLLDCHMRQGLPLLLTEFYDNQNLIRYRSQVSTLQLTAKPQMKSTYKCRKILPVNSLSDPSYMAEIFIYPTDPFQHVEIKMLKPPAITHFPLTLSCNVEVDPGFNLLHDRRNLEFAFFKDGNQVQDYGTSSTYQITKAAVKDSGNYTCYVNYLPKGMRNSEQLEVIVEEIFSTPVLIMESTIIEQGKPINVNCDYSINPHMEGGIFLAYIIKNGQHYSENSSFHIASAQQSDTGEYWCEVSDHFKTEVKTSSIVHVLVEEKVLDAKISTVQQDPDMWIGSNITFTCSIREGTSLSFTWLHNGKEIDKNCESYNLREHGRVLFIGALQQEHSGVYRCNVSNHLSSGMSDELKIRVRENFSVTEWAGGFFLSPNKDIILMPDDSITLTCSLTQGNGSNFFWIHNDRNLKQDTSTYEFREGGKVLHIKSAQPDHEGSYQCGVKKEIHPGRTLVSKNGSYLKPFVIVLVVDLILFISIFILVVHMYENKIHYLLHGRPQSVRGKEEIYFHNLRVSNSVLDKIRSPSRHFSRDSFDLHFP
ncbi:hypothetical protein GDO81_022997 [Engystomops pustulosus]|uniref:Ig-like domain-containing protein n=1 Tax=Engystomops pustulosus TaxID=76066 RepID=A0AAV6ZI62_ENGPU|nr:hypothetical protein GDO81_022997 [Engystomops pustulosus]